MSRSVRTALVAAGHTAMFAVGLLGTCFLGWLGFVAAGGWNPTGGNLDWLWFATIPYLSAWVILTFRSLPRALLVVALLPFAMWVPWGIGLGVGALTFFLLAVPGFVAAGVATAELLFATQRLDGQADRAAWMKVHLPGIVPSTLCLAWGFFHNVNTSFEWGGFLTAAVSLAVALSIHATATWLRLRRDGRARVSPFRVALLLSAAFLASGVVYARQSPDRSALAWSWEFPRDKLFRVKHGDGVLNAGETVPISIGEQELLLTIPDGWRVSVVSWPAIAVTLRPDAASALAIERIEWDRYGRQDWVVPFDPADTAVRDPFKRELGCAIGPPALDGLALCRDLIRPTKLVADTLPSDTLGFRVSPGRGLPDAANQSYFAFGRWVRAVCQPKEQCVMTMRPAAGGEVRVAFPERNLARWLEVKAATMDLMHAAAGVTFADYPPFPP